MTRLMILHMPCRCSGPAALTAGPRILSNAPAAQTCITERAAFSGRAKCWLPAKLYHAHNHAINGPTTGASRREQEEQHQNYAVQNVRDSR
jgi:hypothetical protein